MDQSKQSLNVLALCQALLGGLAALVIGGLYRFRPGALTGLDYTWLIVLLGLLALGYYLSLHQLIKRWRLDLSVLVITVITAINILTVTAQTGGLDSPFNALILLAIVATGLFGQNITLVALGSTVTYYVVALAQHQFSSYYATGHLTQLGMILAASGLAEWVYRRSRKITTQSAQMASLSGQLDQEQFKAQALMNSVGEGVIVVDPNRQIQLFNPAAAAMTGWDANSAISLGYQNVLHLKTADGRDVNDQTDPFLTCWKFGQSITNNNLYLSTKAGRSIALTMTVSPIYDSAHQLSGGIALFRDISSEKEVERQRSEFISTASHEMRTPVASIEGYIALAMNANVATIDERARGFLVKAHDATKHLGDLFRDLLTISKLEQGQVGGQIEPVELGQLVSGAVADLQYAASKKGLTLLLKSGGMTLGDKDILPLYNVMANPERLREVIMNLLDNAIKYTTEGGITVDISGTKDAVTVRVIDTGIGIAAEDIPHLFQKFYRVDNSDTRTNGGTGLGLYLCRTVVEFYGGQIWVESTVGTGSSFNFSLPRLTDQKLIDPAPNDIPPATVIMPNPASDTAAEALATPVAK